ncbi:MarR family winged helix-turn-helix transcriptional regulator [Massilia cavernae]|uniref:MarR family transcriptional regulator n=1 Tax=Massilia cavernae TaxID=2320864 RepID=A0A418Y5R7_9BURK|nr:MarR family transcriptional regulator [Massilia cavernae]RJG22059.1 MarR family transcriptional regulator [Massilia cavernae]
MASPKKSVKTVSVEATTLYMLAAAHHGVRTQIEAALKQFDLTPIQYTVLSVIEHKPGLSSAALARRFYVSPQNMGQLLTLLEQRGLLTRAENPENRRLLIVNLTEEGRSIQALGAIQMQAVERAALKNVPADSIDAFRDTLSIVVNTLRS